MSESKPMRWAKLRERVAEVYDQEAYNVHAALEYLIRDIDAATPAMEKTEVAAECWRRFSWLSEEAMRHDPNDPNVRGSVYLQGCIIESCKIPFEEWCNEQRG